MSQYSNNEANRGVAESNKRLNTDPKPIQKPPKVERLRAVLPEVWTLMRPRRGLLALGFILMVINRVAGLVLPYSSRFSLSTTWRSSGRWFWSCWRPP